MAPGTTFATVIVCLLTSYCYRVPSVLAIPDRKGKYSICTFMLRIHSFAVDMTVLNNRSGLYCLKEHFILIYTKARLNEVEYTIL